MLLLNTGVVNVNVTNANVPAVRVYPVTDEVVRFVPNVNVPLVCVIGTVTENVLPPVLLSVGVPVTTVILEDPVSVLLFTSNMPFVKVSALVAPSVKLFTNVHVAVLVAPPNIHGKS